MGMITYFKAVTDEEIQGFQFNPDTLDSFLFSETEDKDTLDIEKSWHAIHFLLCDDHQYGEPPLNFIVCGGTEIGDDLGYGPARVYNSKELSEIADALEPITEEHLRMKYDPTVFMNNDIYPGCWDEEPIEESLDQFILFYYKDMKDFILKTRSEGKGCFVYLT